MAIQEWSSGSYLRIRFSNDSCRKAEAKFGEKLQYFQLHQRSEWLKFCTKVYEYASRNLNFVNPHQLPYIVPDITIAMFDDSLDMKTQAALPVLERKRSLM